MSATIVSAESGDLDRYLDLLEDAAFWLESRGIRQWKPEQFRASSAFYAGSIANGEVQLAIAGHELAGTLRLVLHEPIVWPDVVEGDGVYVYNLAVSRSWSGRDLGAHLLDWASARAASLGRAFVRLDCMSDNDFLRAYYTRAGFADCGDIDATFPDPVGTLRLRRYERHVR